MVERAGRLRTPPARSGVRCLAALALARARIGLRRAALAQTTRLGLGLAVEVVDLLAGEGEAVDLLAVLVLVVVVLQAPDDVDAAALAEVLSSVVGLLAPEGPQDRGHLVFATLALADVGHDDDGALGDEAFPTLDP